jgi:hypothetical protein
VDTLDEWKWAIEHWIEPPSKKIILQLPQTSAAPQIRFGIDDRFVTKLWFGARRAFGDSKDSAVSACKVGETVAVQIDNALSTLPTFENLHVTSVRNKQKDKENRPQHSLIKLLDKAEVNSILQTIAATDTAQAGALQSLLDANFSDIGLNILALALGALPMQYGLEVAWRSDRHDPKIEQDIKAWQAAKDPPEEPRVFFTKARSTLLSPNRVRVVELAVVLNDVRSTYLTTITRTALEVRSRLITKEKI